MMNFYQWLEDIQPISIGKILGSPSDEFQLAFFVQNGREVGRMNFGLHKYFEKMVNGKPKYIVYGTIDDVFLNVKGTNAMRTIYPVIENRLKKAGATKIKLNTVDDAVGTKVWQPLGFSLIGGIGTGRTKIWEKNLLDMQPKRQHDIGS